ncbi:MAG: penicillin-binding protein activator [Nitrospirota bacterium]|nr:penicillin-binding protein activator [Nitrospirota bacterium]
MAATAAGFAPTVHGADPEAPPPQLKNAPPQKLDDGPLVKAKALLDSQQDDEALDVLKPLLGTAKGDALAQTYFLTASALNRKKNYADAAAYLDRLHTEFPTAEVTDKSRILLATVQANLGKTDQALSLLSEVRTQAEDPDAKRDVLKAIGDVQAIKKDYVRAIQAWLEEMTVGPAERAAEAQERIRRLVQDQADRTALAHIRDAYPTTFPGDLVLIRLIELHQARGEEHLAERNLRLFLTHFPTHDYAPSATEQLRAHKTKLKTSQYVLAAAVPTSGRLSAFGTEALNGIRLAIDKGKEAGLASVGLVVKDTAGLEKTALRTELLELIAEYHPQAVIGPLLSRHLPAAAAVADETDTPFLAPAATTADVRRLGTYLFTTALTYPQQAHRLADYAVGRLGYKRFCILHPDTLYGQELARLFSQEVRQRGGEIIAIESYPEHATDFGPQIKQLKAEDLKRYGTATTSQTSKGATKVTYTAGFDALFLPGSAGQISLLAPQLRFYDIKAPLLGSNTWNTPDLLRLADRSLDGGVFVDGWFQDSPDPAMREFVERYRQKYQSSPTLFAAQAYDAARLALEAIRRGATNGKGLREQLLRGQDLPSLGGLASFGPGGALERRVFLIQVKQGKLVQLE